MIKAKIRPIVLCPVCNRSMEVVFDEETIYQDAEEVIRCANPQCSEFKKKYRILDQPSVVLEVTA